MSFAHTSNIYLECFLSIFFIFFKKQIVLVSCLFSKNMKIKLKIKNVRRRNCFLYVFHLPAYIMARIVLKVKKKKKQMNIGLYCYMKLHDREWLLANTPSPLPTIVFQVKIFTSTFNIFNNPFAAQILPVKFFHSKFATQFLQNNFFSRY